MLSFKKIEQSDINELKKYYDYDECMGCDTNLLNAYLWRNEYNIKFAFYDDTIVKVYCNPDESVWGYCMPTGKNIKGALEEVFKDAEERNSNLQIVMLTNGNRAMLETMFPDKFDYVRSPENQDYIYTSRDLATLAGKRFHAKRNHISKFYRTYTDTRFETLSDSRLQNCGVRKMTPIPKLQAKLRQSGKCAISKTNIMSRALYCMLTQSLLP